MTLNEITMQTEESMQTIPPQPFNQIGIEFNLLKIEQVELGQFCPCSVSDKIVLYSSRPHDGGQKSPSCSPEASTL